MNTTSQKEFYPTITNQINGAAENINSVEAILPRSKKALVSRPEDRKWLQFVPDELISVRVRSAEVGGTYSILEGIFAPQSGPPLHIHLREDETFEILEGSLRFICEGEVFDAHVGTSVVIPKGASHTWKNVTDKPVRALGTFTPGGIEFMFEELAGKSPVEMNEIAQHYGTIFVGPPLGNDQTPTAISKSSEPETRTANASASK